MQRWVLGLAFAAFTGALGAEARSAKAATVAAQVNPRTGTKVETKGGKEVHLTGCVAPASGPADYMLTDVATSGKTPEIVHNYYLVGKIDGLEQHIGQMMEIKGKALDRGKSERKGTSEPLPILDVKSIKMLGANCP